MSLWRTFGLDILRYVMMGARDVLASWEGWLIVSQSSTISCMDLLNSNILSISAWTSARLFVLQLGLQVLPQHREHLGKKIHI